MFRLVPIPYCLWLLRTVGVILCLVYGAVVIRKVVSLSRKVSINI